jgi:Flp pilus assembly protein TadG
MHRTAKTRRGILTLELVIVLPILLVVLLGVVQLASYLMAMQAIQAAALVGAREAALPSATAQSVSEAVHQSLSGWRLAESVGPGDVLVQPEGWQSLPPGSAVAVSVRVDAAQAAIGALEKLGLPLAGKKITAEYVLRRE